MVEARVRRLYRRGRKRMRGAMRTGTATDYHAWRRDAKDLGYVVRLLGAAWEGPLEALADELQQLGKALGDEHDLTVLHEALLAAGGDPPVLTPRLARAIQRRQQSLRARARAVGGRLWVEKPGPFASRLVGYWQVWHLDGAPSSGS
jgi:CHAD domain-containing protein